MPSTMNAPATSCTAKLARTTKLRRRVSIDGPPVLGLLLDVLLDLLEYETPPNDRDSPGGDQLYHTSRAS
jgi:hypothetical protein